MSTQAGTWAQAVQGQHTGTAQVAMQTQAAPSELQSLTGCHADCGSRITCSQDRCPPVVPEGHESHQWPHSVELHWQRASQVVVCITPPESAAEQIGAMGTHVSLSSTLVSLMAACTHPGSACAPEPAATILLVSQAQVAAPATHPEHQIDQTCGAPPLPSPSSGAPSHPGIVKCVA